MILTRDLVTQGEMSLLAWLAAQGFARVAGVDEVGRGCLAGPVVGGAVILNPAHPILGIKDSKLLTPKRREVLAQHIRSQSLSWAVARVEAGVIDRINILKASLLAMAEAVKKLQVQPDCLLVDGNQPLPLDVPQFCVVDGDRLLPTIGAAAIVAKVYRDRLMTDLTLETGFRFDRHKGYGTKEHLRELQEKGPSLWHRQSFAPVKALGGC